MKMYHGTDAQSAEQILKQIDVTRGRGELGQGFYVGNFRHKAYSWAYHKSNGQNYSVVQFDFCDCALFKLNYRYFSRKALRCWRQTGKMHKYNCDMVWAPVMGAYVPGFEQMKFEDTNASTCLLKQTKKQII